MTISITFKDTNAFKGVNHIENTCINADVRNGFLRVEDENGSLHCYNIDTIEAYHLDFEKESKSFNPF